ncbi:MAG: hypothetical protein U1A27_00825 [Phycisphaerae bacterium]
MKRLLGIVSVVSLFAVPAFGQLYDVTLAGPGVYELDGTKIPYEIGGPEVPGATDTYNVYTGVATAAGSLGLLEPSAPPVRDDIVAYDLAGELINDYVAAAGGVIRMVNESLTLNSPAAGQSTLVITVMGTLPAGGPGDLWPSGFTLGGVAATSGGFGIGLGLPASLGGADPLLWNGLATVPVVSGSVRVATSGVFGAPGALPLSFFGNGNWNGVVGIAFGNGATGTGIQDKIELTIVVNKVPEPMTMSLLSLGLLPILRRRK